MLLGQAGNTVYKNTASPHSATGIVWHPQLCIYRLPSWVQVATYALIQCVNRGIALIYTITQVHTCTIHMFRGTYECIILWICPYWKHFCVCVYFGLREWQYVIRQSGRHSLFYPRWFLYGRDGPWKRPATWSGHHGVLSAHAQHTGVRARQHGVPARQPGVRTRHGQATLCFWLAASAW